MPKLAPFRQYNEHDVVNIFALSGYTAAIVDRGTAVKIAGVGIKLDQPSVTEFLGNPSAFSPANVVSQRYGVFPKIVPAGAGDKILGITLFDVRETDENGELLKFRPHKAAEMEAVISGQALPVCRRGTFGYSGLLTGNGLTGTVSAGTTLYAGENATLSSFASGSAVGYTLGATDARGYNVIFLNV